MSRLESSKEAPVHNRLEVLRADRGWSRKQLADEVGVHYQTIGYLERGEYKPSLVLALKVAALFELPVEQVFSLEPFPTLASQLGLAK
ncbi:MAG: helix-turn-helix transcriptional regulator [Gammaproteobacteria bacterium]